MPILTSVSVPSKVMQMSCCSSSTAFSKLAEDGKTKGLWYRTFATTGVQGLIGPNGAGKSTAMKALLGMLKLNYGLVKLDGHDITNMSPQQRVAQGNWCSGTIQKALKVL